MDIDNHALNKKWQSYFNWTITIPLIFFVLFPIAIVFLLILGVITVNTAAQTVNMDSIFMLASGGLAGLAFIVIFAAPLLVIYTIWFILASDALFKALNIDRVVGNILNLIGIFVIPISFFVLPIFFWIKMRDYWDSRGLNYSWRAVLK